MKLPQFLYDLNAGPQAIETLANVPKTGNCRLAVQYYFFVSNGVRFNSEEILCPQSFRSTGSEVISQTAPWNWALLARGDVIFAERILAKDGTKLDRSRASFSTEELWITYLHSAVYLGIIDSQLLELLPDTPYQEKTPLIWHATAVSGGSCVWSIDEFQRYYKLISARRFISES